MLTQKTSSNYLKLSIYLSFILAVIFYFISGKISTNVLLFYTVAILFLIVGTILTIILFFQKFLQIYSIYNAKLMQQREKLYNAGYDFLEIRKMLKTYKKSELKTYKFTNFKYISLLVILSIIVIYLFFVVIKIII